MKLSFPIFEELDEKNKELGRLLFSKEISFVKGVVDMAGLPNPVSYTHLTLPTSG